MPAPVWTMVPVFLRIVFFLFFVSTVSLLSSSSSSIFPAFLMNSALLPTDLSLINLCEPQVPRRPLSTPVFARSPTRTFQSEEEKKKKKKKKKAYLKPYYFGIYFEERENAQKRGWNFHFFLEKRRERDHAPLEILSSTTFCARVFRAACSSLSFIARANTVLPPLVSTPEERRGKGEGENVTRRNRGPRRGKRKGRREGNLTQRIPLRFEPTFLYTGGAFRKRERGREKGRKPNMGGRKKRTTN